MPVVTVSPKFQVVIPREVRDELGIEVGQKIQVIAIENRVEMIPVRSARSMRGFLKGIDTRVDRDTDRV
jgi:AbrB family looped-hinge helix DNA binding protein